AGQFMVKAHVKKATVAVDSLNVRKGPSTSDTVIDRVSNGEAFSVLAERYGWLKISLNDGRTGWVAGQFMANAPSTTSNEKEESVQSTEEPSQPVHEEKEKIPAGGSSVTLLYDGTNLRSGPGTNHGVVAQGSQGDRFTVLGQSGRWYHIQLPSGTDAYVAGWIVVPSKQEQASLSGKTIVVDAGHGGKDTGAVGVNGLLEKNLTLRTVKELAAKLREAGAHVIMTRDNDTFISLQGRVNIAEKYNADAFISIHYNASFLPHEGGITSYYYTKSKDRPLALAIQQMLVKQTDRRNRGVRFANYHVLRENSQPATLLELGFVTNPWEVHVIRTSTYQDSVTTAIVDGVENYFQAN
ncbi:MAG TPA: N-acetylmuramoyl-L-alanine amidase, partial [Bacillales bacterium]|nr:N-acetylmuramoyl-L-alanine amidase [Bacillales bacterium]